MSLRFLGRDEYGAATSGKRPVETFVPRLREELDVWVICLDSCRGSMAALRQVLCAEECSRANRFCQSADRERFCAARGGLRHILANYVPADPASLRFRVAHHGKPALVTTSYWPDIRFNVSHSSATAICAVAMGREVGVDIERLDQSRSYLPVAARFFSLSEVADLHKLPSNQRVRGFFNCWTRKEAYVKGRGGGFSIPLGDFDVSLVPGEPAALLGSRSDPEQVDRWSLQDLTVAEDYAAALAVETDGALVYVRLNTFVPP